MDKFDKTKYGSIMTQVENENTTPEFVVRKLLFSMGYRYRLHRKVVLNAGEGDRYNTQRQNIMKGLKLFSTEYLADGMRFILSELDAPFRLQ
jgi:G:T-mismatch repair DNA endonuclease (very short patch repair protein)